MGFESPVLRNKCKRGISLTNWRCGDGAIRHLPLFH